jgi:hypothetical protein
MNLRDSGIGTSGFSLTFTFAGGRSPATRKPDTQIETEPVIDRSLR